MPALLFVAVLCAAEPAQEPLQLLQTFRNEFVAITPGQGKFPAVVSMGREEGGREDERPTHRVTFEYDFQIAKYEVTQELWAAVMGSNPSRWKGSRNSVERLSFAQAQEFCRRVTQRLRDADLIEAKQVIRLPSEAEWEYVARAGSTTRYSFGDDASELTRYGWFAGNAAGNDPPVGAKAPNPWGLYDIHGYLSEWCSDDWHDNYQGAPTDGQPWTSSEKPSTFGVTRGGSWKDPAHRTTSSARTRLLKTHRDDAVGLRCVLGRVES